MFEPVNFHRAAEVRNFFKFHLNQLLFSSSIELYVFALAIKKDFSLFKSSQQQWVATTL